MKTLIEACIGEECDWCMQVPSFDSKVAMTMIEQELGQPWQAVYSQLTPRPIAAASLGQVCALPLPLVPCCSLASSLLGLVFPL